MPTKLAPALLAATAADPAHFRFAAAASTLGVDPATGNMTNLLLMAAGREAKGYGIFIDDQTLATALAAAQERGGRLKSYVTHNHSGPCSSGPSWMECPGMDDAENELNIPGFFSGLAVKKSQLLAAAFEFYDAFKANYKPQYDQLVEMARKTPDLLGLSVECWGYLVYVAKDGTEYSAEPENVELLYNGMPALRITDLWAAAFVSDGAATDSLFAQLSTRVGRLFGAKHGATRAELAAALRAVAEGFSVAEVSEGRLGDPSVTNPPPSPDISATMKIIAALKTKFAADEKKFAAAMLIVGHTPADQVDTLTVEAIEAQLATAENTQTLATLRADLATAAGQVTALTANLATATGQVTALTAERDDWKRKFETLKTSGNPGAVDLGTGTGGGGGGNGTATGENPWILGPGFNRTAQAEIFKADKPRAEALKAAAKVANAAKK